MKHFQYDKTNWKTSETYQQFKIVGYQNIVGSPAIVEYEVNSLIKKGWEPKGDLMPFTPTEGKDNNLFLQCMVKYERKEV